MSQSARKYLKAQVAEDKLEEVLKYLLDDETKVDDEIRSTAMLQSGRLSSVNNQLSDGTISQENADLERNRVRKALQDLTSDLPLHLKLTTAKETFAKRRNLGWLVGGLIYLLIGSILLLLAFSPKKNLRIEASIDVEQITFTHIDGYYKFSGKPLKRVRLGNIEWLELEGDSIAVDTLDNGKYRPLEAMTEIVILKPFQEVRDQTILFKGDLSLDGFPVKANSIITLSNPNYSGVNDNIRVTVEHKEPIEERFEYTDSVHLLPEYYSVEGLEEIDEFEEETKMVLNATKGSKHSMRFKSLKDMLYLNLTYQDTLNLSGERLEIASPSFFRKDDDLRNETPISTILSGEIKVVEPKREPMYNYTLEEKKVLYLTSNTSFQLERIRFNESRIKLDFYGDVDRIEIGDAHEVYNPSLLEWLWHNHQWPLSGVGLLLLGFVFFLPKLIQTKIIGTLKSIKDLT